LAFACKHKSKPAQAAANAGVMQGHKTLHVANQWHANMQTHPECPHGLLKRLHLQQLAAQPEIQKGLDAHRAAQQANARSGRDQLLVSGKPVTTLTEIGLLGDTHFRV